MKQIYRHSIATSLFSLSALLLCLGSCQSSDNTEVGEGATVASLPLKVQIGDDASSRVGMTDGSTFSCYWNSDKLNIYQKYVLNGTVQSMMSLPFSTTTTSGLTATFSYTGGAYRYNPGSRFYAFSKGTSGDYTASVAADGTSTLTAHTLASQLGTLTDCATYDALYGSANVNYDTGLPEPLTMHHLFGMFNLHLTNSGFSTSKPVTVTLNVGNTTDGGLFSNLLPSNDGSITYNPDGTVKLAAGKWNSWYVTTITPSVNGVVDIYLQTWAFTPLNAVLAVSCSDASANTYMARDVTLSNFSLSNGVFKSRPLAISSFPAANYSTYSLLYAWGATDGKPVTIGTIPTNANTSTVINTQDCANHAVFTCGSCPNLNETNWYLSVSCYWDPGNISGGNTTSYKMANGNYTKAGMWFKKKSGIPGFSAAVGPSSPQSQIPVLLTSALVSSLNLQTNYFFLPAAGHTAYDTGAFLEGGTMGSYWLSSPDNYGSNQHTNLLHFTNATANLSNNLRTNGLALWWAQ